MNKTETKLTNTLYNAFLLLNKKLDECEKDNPTFWNIKETLKKQGKKVDGLSTYFGY